eukprot:2713181-Rhodomonas_salina.1
MSANSRPFFAATFPVPLVRPPRLNPGEQRSASSPAIGQSPRPADASLFDNYFGRGVSCCDFQMADISSGSDQSTSEFDTPGDEEKSRFYGGYRTTRAKSLDVVIGEVDEMESQEPAQSPSAQSTGGSGVEGKCGSLASDLLFDCPKMSTESQHLEDVFATKNLAIRKLEARSDNFDVEAAGRDEIPSREEMKRNSMHLSEDVKRNGLTLERGSMNFSMNFEVMVTPSLVVSSAESSFLSQLADLDFAAAGMEVSHVTSFPELSQ